MAIKYWFIDNNPYYPYNEAVLTAQPRFSYRTSQPSHHPFITSMLKIP
ncbi:MAG: hypothetical protein J6L03_05095 [Bacteroidaceae bacterium]|nr:hypothetical protein [Bacteroidaceae bacterium]